MNARPSTEVHVDIRPIRFPDRLEAADAAELHAYERQARLVDIDAWGNDDLSYSAAELLALHHDRAFRDRVELGAWAGDRLVGSVSMTWERDGDATTAEATLGVDPAFRRRGIGTRLLEEAEATARDVGRPVLSVWSDHGGLGLATTGEVLRAPDGSAGLPLELPASRFALAHGYALMQVERVSGLSVSAAIEAARRELAARTTRAASDGYELVTWEDRAPEGLVDAYARARARMVLDVPAGGLTLEEEHWDAARVRANEAQIAAAGRRSLVAAAVTSDGAVAAYTELELPQGRSIAYQSDTLVVGPHRGHGLGMLVKLANLVRLADTAPERSDVYTWNADENEHMLAINIAMGFELRGLGAAWQRPV
jgi:GNAT superfamily N-acetyltransferase